MRKILYLVLIVLLFVSCSTTSVLIKNDFPQTFDEAEIWFDDLHKPIEITSTDTIIKLSQK